MATKNYGTYVSNVLDIKNRNFNGVIFQQKRPPLDSELNVIQELSLERISDVIRTTTPSGFLEMSDISGAPEDRTQLSSDWPNVLRFKNPWAIVNGWKIHIGGGTNQFQNNAQFNIWNTLSNDSDEIVYIGEEAPHLGYRQDLLFLEVWQKLIGPKDTLPIDGFIQTAQGNNVNDLIDENITIETSKRIQIQYRFRWIKGVDFSSYREGVDYLGVFAQGPLSEENTNYNFSKSTTDPGLYIAGDGTTQAQTDLNTVDGYIYALPVARIHRRNRQTYSLTNQNGASKSLLSGITSERPDGLYYDEISNKDIEDLRHLVSLNNFDYKNLLEQGLHDLWTNTIPKELKYSQLDQNVSGNTLIQVDGISTSIRSGVNDTERNPDARTRVFTEGRGGQILSHYISQTVLTSSQQIIFTTFGKGAGTGVYELFDENRFYVANVTPRVFSYDTSTNTITQITGGTWEGLGEFRTYDYTSDPNHNSVVYTPTFLNIPSLLNKKTIFEFQLTLREGGGLGASKGGFTYPIDRILAGKNDKDGKYVEFNYHTDVQRTISLTSPRVTGNFTDSAIARSISHFESEANPSAIGNSRYKAGVVELTYYIQSVSGATSELIPKTLYDRDVVSVLSVYNITKGIYQTPIITIQTNDFKLDSLFASAGDVWQVTLLLGNYSVDYIKSTKGIKNVIATQTMSDTVISGQTTGIINVKEKNSLCDGILALAGFYDGVQYRHIAYLGNRMVFLDSLEGLGSALFKYTLSTPASSPGGIHFPILGYYNLDTNDEFYFEYEYAPYAGILQTHLGLNDVQNVKILKMDDNVAITTAGSGCSNQLLPNKYHGLASYLPMNNKLSEYNIFSENIETSFSGGTSSLRRIPIRDLVGDVEDADILREGQILELSLGSGNKSMLRGAIISSPKIVESSINFTTGFNHLNQWTALVEGQGDFWGEIFLLVITTVSSIYNASEGSIHEYLENKGLYVDNALGLGSETILNNSLSDVDLSLNFGNKIYGAVDIFPLRYRPLIKTSSSRV